MSVPERPRALGVGSLTLYIYEFVRNADRPVTRDEIYAGIKDHINMSDTHYWWEQRRQKRRQKNIPPAIESTGDIFDFAVEGRRRVTERIRKLSELGILISDGKKGRGAIASYTAGRRPSEFRHKSSGGEGPYGWREYDFEAKAAKTRELVERMAARIRRDIEDGGES